MPMKKVKENIGYFIILSLRLYFLLRQYCKLIYINRCFTSYIYIINKMKYVSMYYSCMHVGNRASKEWLLIYLNPVRSLDFFH